MKVAGIHPLGHDSCIVEINVTDRTILASTLERFSRKKHDARYLKHLFNLGWQSQGECACSCISNVAATYTDIKQAELFQKRYELDRSLQKKFNLTKKIQRLGNSLWARTLSKMAIRSKNDTDRLTISIQKLFPSKKVLRADHHLCHAASAFYTRPSDFINDLVITLDGQGDSSSGKIFRVENSKLKEVSSNTAEHSICGLYSIFTEVVGYAPNADEGKLEALANFHKEDKSELLEVLREAFYVVNGQLIMRRTKDWPFNDVFGQRTQIKQFLSKRKVGLSNEELSYVIQTLFEEKVSAWIAYWSEGEAAKLCVAGGGFANVKLNRVLFEKYGHQLHIFPAMGDDGAAFGAAILACLEVTDEITWMRDMREPYFGSPYEKPTITQLDRIKEKGLTLQKQSEADIRKIIAQNMIAGKIGAVYRGKAEFGPRALGNRSIIAGASNPKVRDDLNNRFKRREWYQPFCPMILEEDAPLILENYYVNRHMTCAFTVKQEYNNLIPAVVHVDGTARAQIITQQNDFWYEVLKEVKQQVGLGVALNTSFNLHGRAIVNSIDDALDDFLDCGIDYLILDNLMITR